MRERLAEKGWPLGQARGVGAGAWCRTTSGVAEKNLDRDRIAKQRLVKPDGPHNHSLNGRGVWIIDDRAVECWNND